MGKTEKRHRNVIKIINIKGNVLKIDQNLLKGNIIA